LVRGALIGWYPYPFIDVTRLGYVRITLNCCLIALLFGGLTAAAALLDARLPGPAGPAAPDSPAATSQG
jgi:hypothetical protein